MTARNDTVETWIEFSFQVPSDRCDALCDFIIENFCKGLVLEDPEGTDQTVIRFYVTHDRRDEVRSRLKQHLQTLFKGGPNSVPKVKEAETANVAWEEEYRKSIKAIFIGDDIVIRPTWDPANYDRKYELILEPRMAFGTGTHETTRSCLEIIVRRFKEGRSFLDVGCGSGILAVLAARMGASHIKAVDNDPIAVDNCRENFAINSISIPFEIALSGGIGSFADKPFDFVCANIIKSTILEMMNDLIAATKADGILLLSGLLEKDIDEVRSALKRGGQEEELIHQDNEWRTIVVFRR